MAAPEMKIILSTLLLLEKAASGLGKLAFIWATVVLLGAFSETLETVEFWIITIILLTEGARILMRSQEDEWQRGTMLLSMPTLRHEAKLLIRSFCWLQLLSASTCVVLSVYRLARQHYGVDSGSYTKNLKPALYIFYCLSLAESLLFLVEKAYWQWKIIAEKLLTQVKDEYGFADSELDTVRHFFYDTYSRCVSGSVFDGLKMKIVSYSVELLQSSSSDGQLRGARVLSALANNYQFEEETLREIGTTRDVVERLIEMLNWRNPHEQEIRRTAAQIISRLVTNNRNCIRLTAIAGSMESIASLLYSTIDSNQPDGTLVSLGLTILQRLAEDRSNCAKIRRSRGLLPKIIALTKTRTIQNDALQLVATLATTTGSTGKALRKGMSEIVFAISNLRDVLEYKEISMHPQQILAIDTLTSLAREQDCRKNIGGTGGVLSNLFSLFFNQNVQANLVSKAGEALGFLSLESKPNCEIMMSIKLGYRPNLVARLISVLNNPVQDIHVLRILRNLRAYAKADYVELREITATAAQVLEFVMERSGKHQEAAIGLAAQIFKFMTRSDFDRVFEDHLTGLTKNLLIWRLVEVFQSQPRPSREVPSIRRFSIELLINIMIIDRSAIEVTSELHKALEGVIETTSELESYSTFSGSVGLSRHHRPIRSLAQSAMVLLRN